MTRSGTVAAAAMALSLAGTWLVWRGDDTSVSSSPRRLDGAAVFAAKGCAVCHDGPATTAAFDSFPSLADAPRWAADRVPGLTADEYVRQSVLAPGQFTSPAFRADGGPTTGMPGLQVSPAELDALVDFVLQRSQPRS